MAKIYTKGNYFYIEKDGRRYDGLRKDVKVYKNTSNETTYFFEKLEKWENNGLNIQDIQKENGDPYTLLEWEDFYTENTGSFNNGGGNGMGLQGSNTLYFDDATYVYISGLRANGDWYVNRNTIADNTQTTATETNNGGQTTQPLDLATCQSLIYS